MRRPLRRLGGIGIWQGSLFALGATASAAQSPGPLVTDRPDRTESAVLVAPGFVQLELGWSFGRSRRGAAVERSHSAPQLLVRVGALQFLEARLGLPGWTAVRESSDGSEATRSGLGDGHLGVKLHLVAPSGGRPRVAAIGTLTLPTGGTGLGSGRPDPSLRLALVNDLGSRLSVAYNVGAGWVTERAPERESPGRKAHLLYTVSLGLELGRGVALFAETFGFVALAEGREDRRGLNGGLTLLLAPNLQLDASGGLAPRRGGDEWFAGAGASVRLPR